MRFHNVDATVALNYEGGGWTSEGWLISPAANTIVADTAPLAAGIYDFTLFLHQSVTGRYVNIDHRNAANTNNVMYQTYPALANQMIPVNIFGYKIDANERLRLSVVLAPVGDIHGSILWVKRV